MILSSKRPWISGCCMMVRYGDKNVELNAIIGCSKYEGKSYSVILVLLTELSLLYPITIANTAIHPLNPTVANRPMSAILIVPYRSMSTNSYCTKQPMSTNSDCNKHIK